MQLIWTEKSRDDLIEICDYIAQDDMNTAARVSLAIPRAVERLIAHPFSGKPGRVEGTRELVIPRLPYIAVYVVQSETVVVLRVLHAAMEIEKILEADQN